MIDFITARGWTIDFTFDRCPAGFIEFRHKAHLTFWRQTLKDACAYPEGVYGQA